MSDLGTKYLVSKRQQPVLLSLCETTSKIRFNSLLGASAACFKCAQYCLHRQDCHTKAGPKGTVCLLYDQTSICEACVQFCSGLLSFIAVRAALLFLVHLVIFYLFSPAEHASCTKWHNMHHPSSTGLLRLLFTRSWA